MSITTCIITVINLIIHTFLNKYVETLREGGVPPTDLEDLELRPLGQHLAGVCDVALSFMSLAPKHAVLSR